MAAPPVVRFLDFGQYKYELTKREKEAKRKQRSVTFKEVRLSPKIGSGDFDTKVHRAIEFLEDGDRIKVTVRFRGRELTHPEIGRTLLAKFGDAVKDHGVVERAPLLEGKSMFITLASVHKPKVHEHRIASAAADARRTGRDDDAGRRPTPAADGRGATTGPSEDRSAGAGGGPAASPASRAASTGAEAPAPRRRRRPDAKKTTQSTPAPEPVT